MFDLTEKEEKLLRRLDSPAKIQDFLNKIPINFDYDEDTCMSPRNVLKEWKCHCIEGAFLAALALRFQGKKPLVVHMAANDLDEDHVITVFKEEGKWGAISKTNHGVLRYREPIYNNLRELIMSFFHEYTDDEGRKNLVSYSVPVNLARFDNKGWATDDKDLWYIDDYLDKVKHYNLLGEKQIKNLRDADKIEIDIGKVTEWKNKKS